MKLNEIELISYSNTANTADFILECDFNTANSLNGQKLTVTSNDETVAVFGGYNLTSLSIANNGYTHAQFTMALEPDTAQAIEAIKDNQAITHENQKELQTQIDELAGGLIEIAEIIAEGM